MFFKNSIAVVLTAVALVAAPIFSLTTHADDAKPIKQVPQSQINIQQSFAPLVKAAAPAVVNVYAARRVKSRRSPFEGDPFFERFFGKNALGRPQERVERSLGSGVIVRSDGLIVTNHHVIKGATEIKVALTDGREFECDVVLLDEKSDLAVLHVKDKGKVSFPTLTLGDSEKLEVGDLVLAIGNPFGVGQTVTSGIVSALSRSRVGVSDFGFFIQTDAAINPGNSGGALVDVKGNLIGINTAIYSKSGGSNGIGFAIPSNMVNVILKSVEQGSNKLLRPYIGASFQPITSEIAESLGLKTPQGILVLNVVPDGPSDKVGLNIGDVLLSIDGHIIRHPDELGYRLATHGVGGTAKFGVYSKGKTREISVPLEVAPETVPRDIKLLKGRAPFAGAVVANLSPALAVEMDLDPSDQGVVIIKVQRGSPAQRFRLQVGDIIRKVNKEDVISTEMLDEMVRESARSWRYEIERGGRIIRQFVR